MPATTPGDVKIPYPVAADKMSDYPGIAKQAAEKLDNYISPSASMAATGSTDITTTVTGVVRSGVAHLGGDIIKSAGFISGSTTSAAITLPPGLRPLTRKGFACAASTAGANPPGGLIVHVTVTPAGIVDIANKFGSTASTIHADSIIFPVV